MHTFHCPASKPTTYTGKPFPRAIRDILVTAHARKRLLERFPEYAFRPDEAAEVLRVCVRAGRLLTPQEVRRVFETTPRPKGATACYSPDLGGVVLLKLAPGAAVVVIVYAATVRPEYAARLNGTPDERDD